MQQTEKYKLNLIESSDPFLPDALNQNTQKIEDAMTAHEEGIEQRLTVLEAHKLVLGKYKGTEVNASAPVDAGQVIHIGFCPRFVAVWGSSVWLAYLPELGSQDSYARSTEDGFYIRSLANQTSQEYRFLAFA